MTETTKKTTNTATKKDVAAAQAVQSVPKEVKKPLAKFGKQETYTAEDGTEYTFQFPGVRRAQEILDESKNMVGVIMETSYNEKLFDEVIVKPHGIDWEYWNENDGYREVMAAADNFLGRML